MRSGKAFERRISNDKLATLKSRVNELYVLTRLRRSNALSDSAFITEVGRIQGDLYKISRRQR